VANGAISSLDAFIDLVESIEIIEHFISRLQIYIHITPTPEVDKIAVKIMAELLIMLGVMTQKLEQRQSSMSFLAVLLRYSARCSQICKEEIFGGQQHRGYRANAKPAHARRGTECRRENP
jgi:hypothetical protein